MKMTLDEMLAHIEKYHGMVFKNQPKGIGNTHTDVFNKIWRLLPKFGFNLVQFNKQGATFRLELKNHHCIDVYLTYIENAGYEPHTTTYEGILHVTKKVKSINPHTGEPWKIGDVDYDNPLQPLLTANGWWTGD